MVNSGRYNSAAYYTSPQRVLNTTGWVLLLPFLEQSAAADRYNYTTCSSNSNPYGRTLGGSENTNLAITGMQLAAIECPSDPEAGMLSSLSPGGSNFYDRNNARRTSYLFNTGVFTDYDAAWETKKSDVRNGAFGNNGAATFGDITDGTSNTALIGESWGGIKRKTSADYGPWGLRGLHTSVHGRVYTASATDSATASLYTSQAKWNVNANYSGGKVYAWQYNSGHPGGALFVFGDGNVRFIGETINYKTFVNLNYISDSQVLGEF